MSAIRYDVKQVCVNGHQITDFARTQPESRRNFCDRCGARTITTCANCGTEIEGYPHIEGVFGSSGSDPPDYCPTCGVPFPWAASKSEGSKIIPVPIPVSGETKSAVDPLAQLERALERFPLVARRLTERHAGRQPFVIDDEYDVQDLLYALLSIDFDDVRREDPAPNFAGASTRLDLVLKKEQIVVEVKKTRNALTDKKLGEELTVDIARYRAHPDCKTLFCFVYDPDGIVKNPHGLITDLERLSGTEMHVRAIIAPC